jgi:hypothetical protein
MKGPVAYIVYLYFRLSFIRKFIWSLLIFLIFSLVSVIIFTSSRISPNPIGWERTFYISGREVTAKNIQLVTSGNFVAITFQGRQEGKAGIYVSVSFNRGSRFLAPVKIAELSSDIQGYPVIAISGKGELTVAWQDMVETELTNRIFSSASTDFGANWTKPLQVYIGYEMEMLPRIFYDNRSRLHLFFHGLKERSFVLYHALRESNGKYDVTGEVMELDESMRGAFFPAIYFAGNNIFMVWQGKGQDFTDDLFFMKSESYGDSWSTPVRITQSKANDASPSLILKDDTLYVVYRNNDTRNWRINMLRGFAFGEVWETKPLQISETNADCYAPDIVYSKNTLYIVWYDSRERNTGIYSRKYNIRETKLADEVKLSSGRYSARNPELISIRDKVVVFWEEAARIAAKYNDIYVAAPLVYSTTHPAGQWSKNSVAVIRWKPPADESGIVGYATLVNRSADMARVEDINPTIQNINANITRRVIPSLEDGIAYFHIRAIDGSGNFSRTIHYRIQVSANPLPIPVVVSPTHKLGKAADSNTPKFKWAMDNTERLKGFLYSLSKDGGRPPDKFTTNFNTEFKDLEEGRYFFSLTAINKTNMKSRVAVYPFIVGKSGKIDIADLKDLGRKDITYKKKPLLLKPEVAISFPFNLKESYNRESFNAIIETKNLPEKRILGYSILIGSQKSELRNRINHKSKIMNVEGLKSGVYTIGVKAKYYRSVRGKKKILWTAPYFRQIMVDIPPELSPVEYYTGIIIKKISDKSTVVISLIIGLMIFISVLGFGSKIVFFTKLLQYRFRALFRL